MRLLQFLRRDGFVFVELLTPTQFAGGVLVLGTSPFQSSGSAVASPPFDACPPAAWPAGAWAGAPLPCAALLLAPPPKWVTLATQARLAGTENAATATTTASTTTVHARARPRRRRVTPSRATSSRDHRSPVIRW